MAFFDNWMTQLRKGVVELGLLNALSDGPQYGYELARRLGAVDGLLTTQGTLYPLLLRMHREGLVLVRMQPSPDGPDRKYYRLSQEGRRMLARMNPAWQDLSRGVSSLQANGDST